MKVEMTSGEVIDLGATETTPTITLTDYSRRETDDFGVTTVVPRGFARRMSVRLGVPFERADAVQRRLADLRAAEARWIADDRFRWLDFEGFYKNFEIDLATPPLSRCTLEVEGLAATETLFDGGGDPAPDDAASTLRLLQPVPVTDAMLVANNVAENDYAEWSNGTTYGIGDRVIRGASHRIYESAAAANVGNDPVGTSGKWLDIGPTNRWAMFDQAIGTTTTSAGEIGIILNTAVTAVALLDVSAAAVQVEAGGYERTIAVGAGPVVFLDVPATGQVVIRIKGPGAVSVGTLLVGRLVTLGITEASPTAGITDYSRKEVDAFGSVSIVERAFAKRMTARALIRTDAIDVVANRIASVRARPALWIGETGMDSLTVYGFFKDFSIEVGENVSKLSLSIEGLSKAAPRVRPATVLIPRGFFDPAITYRDGDFVQHEGSTWLYIAPVESSGNEPPELPVEEDGYWRIMARAGRIGRDGVSAYAILLTNENHILPADPDGSVITYTGASTGVVIYSAGDDVTGSFTLSVGANPQGLAVTISGATAAVTGGLDTGEPNATLTLRMTGRDGYAGVTLEKVFSLTKSRAGADGKSPPLVTLTASRSSIRYNRFDQIVSGDITLTTYRTNNPDTPVFRIEGFNGTLLADAGAAFLASNYPDYFTSTGPDNLTMRQGWIDAADNYGDGLKVTATTGSISDIVSMPKVKDGTDGTNGTNAVVGYLTNEGHVVPCTAAGVPITFDGAAGQFRVFSGLVDVTADCTFAEIFEDNASVAPAFVGRSNGIYQADALHTDVGIVGLRATYGSVTIDKRFTLTKSRAAIDGTSPALVQITASAQSVKYDGTGVIVPGQGITFRATIQNAAGTPVFHQYNAAGDEVFGGTAATFAAAGPNAWSSPDLHTLIASSAGLAIFFGGTTTLFGMGVTLDSEPGLSDRLTVVKVQDGARGQDGSGGLVGYLTNESHVVPCTAAGAPLSFTGANGQFRVFVGLTEVTNDCTFAEVSNSGAGVVGNGGFNGQSGGYYQADELTADIGTVLLRATYKGVAIDKAFTLTKSRAAVDGTSPALISLSASRQTVQYDKADTIVSGPITFATTRQNSSATPIFRIEGFDGSGFVEASAEYLAANIPHIFTSTGPDNLTITQDWARAVVDDYGGGIKVIAKLGETGLSDTMSLPKVKDGSDGLNGASAYSMILTNEAVVLPATADGTIVSYAPATTSIQIFRGSLDVTSAFAHTADTNPQNLGYAGGYPDYRFNTGFDAGEDTASFTFQVSGSGAHAGVVLRKTMTFAKSKAAIDGTSPPLLNLDASTYTLRQATDGTFYSGQPVTFTAARQNTTGLPRFQVRDHTGAVLSDLLAAEYAASYPSTWSSPNADTLIWSAAGAASDIAAYGGPTGRVGIRAYVAGTAAIDAVSVQAIRDGQKGADGQGALSAFLSNESFTYAVDAANQPDAVPGGVGNGRMRVFKGAVEVTTNCTFTVQMPYNLVATIDGAGNYAATYLGSTGGYAYLIASYEGTALVLTLTGSKSAQGGAGANAKSLYVTSTSQTITVDAAGNLSPAGQDISFRALKQNTSAVVDWRLLDRSGTLRGTRQGDTCAVAGQDVLNIIAAGGSDARAMTVEASLIDGVTLSDTISVVKVSAGANGTAGASAFTLLDVANCPSPGPTYVVKTGGGDHAFNGKARTSVAFPTVTMSGRMDPGGFLGFDDAPTRSISYDDFDYAWHISSDGHDFVCYWNGTVQVFVYISPYTLGALYTLTSDNEVVRFFRDGQLMFTAPMFAKQTLLYGAFALSRLNARVYDIAFGASGPLPPTLTIQASSQVLKLRADGSIPPGTPDFTFAAARQGWSGPVGFHYTDVAGMDGGEVQNGDVLTIPVARLRDVLNAAVAQGKGPQIGVKVEGGGLSAVIAVNLVVDGAKGEQGASGISAPQPVTLTEPDGTLDAMLLAPGQGATVFYRAVFRNNLTSGTVTIQLQYRVNGGGWNFLDQRATFVGPGEPGSLSWAAAYGNGTQDEQTVQFRAISDAPGGTEVSSTAANYLRVQ